jgi:hypothetical protein
MAHQWLINELEGLRDYAELNGLSALAEHLEQARLLAHAEIATRQPEPAMPSDVEARRT